MTLSLTADASVRINEATLSDVLNEVLLDRLISFGVKLTILLFFVAFTVAVILHVYGRLQFPVALRKYVYGAYLALMVGTALSLRTGAPTAEASAQKASREITKVLLDSGRMSELRSVAVVDVKTGAAPASTQSSGRGVVYIQIPNVATRAAAERVRKALQDAGYSAPGVEIIDPKFTPGTSEIRYFNKQDDKSAEEIAGIAGAAGLPGPPYTVKLQDGFKAPAGQIELWFPRPS